MGNYMYGATALFVAAAMAVGGYVRSDMGGFDYASASPDEQQQWLDAQLISIGKTMSMALPKSSGADEKMAIRKTVANADEKRIDVIVGVSVPTRIITNSTAAPESLLKGLCGKYMKTGLARNGIMIGLKIDYSDGKRALSLPLTPTSCSRYPQA